MAVMFVSRRGSMYQYFRFLSANLSFNTRVYDFSFRPYFRSKISDLTPDDVRQGIEFHLERKRVKHNFSE
jgi:hypothetical protein